MSESKTPTTDGFSRFEFWVGELIDTCEQLKRENTNLRQEQSVLLDEKMSLTASKNQVARRLEALIGRLKRMEAV